MENGKFNKFSYPLKPLETKKKFGFPQSTCSAHNESQKETMKLTYPGFLLQWPDALSDCHRFEKKFHGLALRMTLYRKS